MGLELAVGAEHRHGQFQSLGHQKAIGRIGMKRLRLTSIATSSS
jgi:hypothetical protein